MDANVKRRLQGFRDELDEITEKRRRPFEFGIIQTKSTRPIRSHRVWSFAESFVTHARGKRDGFLRIVTKPVWVDPFPDGTACLRWAGDEDAILLFKEWATRLSAFLKNNRSVCPKFMFRTDYHGLLLNLVAYSRSDAELSFLVDQNDMDLFDLSHVDASKLASFPISITQERPLPAFFFEDVLVQADYFGRQILQHLMGEPLKPARLVVDSKNSRASLDGEWYKLDPFSVAIVEVLVKAGGASVTRNEMKDRHPWLKNQERIDRLIKNLRKECPAIGELIMSSRTGYLLPESYLA